MSPTRFLFKRLFGRLPLLILDNPARSLVLVSAMILSGLCSQAQTTISTGSIQGTVTDQSGAVVPAAKISITNKSTGRLINVSTTTGGTYASGALTPDNYILRVEAQGFKTSELSVTVQVGVTASGNVKLQVGQATQVIEVQAGGLQINIEQATVEGVLTTQQIENLPTNGRNFLDLAQLEPGVQIQDGGNFDPTKNGFSSISFGGRFGRTARIEVDGLDISDETVGTTTQNIPEGAIQEFQIEQSSLDLSTELTSSGSVNVTTRPGTNAYHGEGYYLFRDYNFDANLPGASDNYFQRNQFGGSFGGAFIKDKLFFFVDAERTKQDLLNPVLSGGPFRAITGNYDSPFREAEAVGRLDWQINNNYKLFYRFSYDENKDVSAVLPNVFQPFANINHTPVHAGGLDFNTGPYTHSVRFGYTKFRNGVVDATIGTGIFDPLPHIELAIGTDPLCLTSGADFFCSGPSYLAPQQTYQSNHQIKYDGSRAIGKHILRYGGGLNYLWGGGFASFLGLAPAVGANITDCNATCLAQPGGASNPLNYPVQSVVIGNGVGYGTEIPRFGFPAGGTGPDYRTSGYFGDAWKVRLNLTVTYGLRYVRDTFRSDADLPPVPALNLWQLGLGRSVNQPNLNFAPQLGIAWDPSGKGKTVLRGGIGLFYENAIWNNTEFDRPGRLPTGLFLQTPTVCSGGTGASKFTLSTGHSVPLNFTCGTSTIGAAAPEIEALQAEYQAATATLGLKSPNPGYIGTTLAAGNHIDGVAMLAPNYVSPRSVQMNFGLQHQFGKGTVFEANYLRNIETHTLLGIDVNHVGDARHFSLVNAQAAIAATLSACGAGVSSINAAIASCPGLHPGGGGASISDFATNGLDSGYSLCLGGPCPTAAFPGIHPNLGANQMLFPIGRSEYNGLQLSFKQAVQNPFKNKSLNLQASYSLSKYIATAADSDFINVATDFENPLRYVGPNGLDRRHQFSLGGWMDMPYSFNVGVITHFYSPLPQNLYLPTTGLPGGIFASDVTGDGTGDGSFSSNGGLGDILPGMNLGSFARSVNAGNINNVIRNYNQNFANQPTPAGEVLINNGLFTLAQLQKLSGVQQLIPFAPPNEANMSWLKALDLRLSWKYKIKDRVVVQPGLAFFNVMNFANFNGPLTLLSGTLSGTVGAVNGTPGEPPNSNRTGTGSGVFALGAPRQLEFSLKASF